MYFSQDGDDRDYIKDDDNVVDEKDHNGLEEVEKRKNDINFPKDDAQTQTAQISILSTI